MVTMQLQLNIDAQKFIQQVQLNNEMIEGEIEKGLNKAFDELSKDGEIEKMIFEAVKKNIMDSFSRWVFQTDIRNKIEKQLSEKMSEKVEKFTDALVNEISEKLNLPKD